MDTGELVRKGGKKEQWKTIVERIDLVLMDDRLMECVTNVGYTYKKVLGAIIFSKKEKCKLIWKVKDDLEDPFTSMDKATSLSVFAKVFSVCWLQASWHCAGVLPRCTLWLALGEHGAEKVTTLYRGYRLYGHWICYL